MLGFLPVALVAVVLADAFFTAGFFAVVFFLAVVLGDADFFFATMKAFS